MAEIAIGIATELGVKTLEKLFEKVSSTAKDKIKLVRSLDNNIGFLKETLPGVKGLMLNAHAVITVDSQSPALMSKEFVKRLRKFVYDGEDIVDDFDIKVGRGGMGKIQKLAIAGKLKRLYAKFQGLLQSKQDAENILKSLKENLRAHGRESNPSLLRKPSMSMIKRGDFQMVGRETEKTSLVRDLLGNKSKPSVVLLTGMGGIGKTTLAHTVLKDPEIASHFAFRKWVMGNRNLDPKKVLEQLVDGTSDTLDQAKEKVRAKLQREKKRFLIVLDDVWDAEDLKHRWNELWDPLSYGGEGSRVIVTTQEEQVKCSMQALPVEVRKLGYLSNEEGLQIFEAFAFPDGFDIPSSSTCSSSQELEIASKKGIGKKIVDEKVKGVPLAARVIGSSLRGKDVKYWEAAATQIKERDIDSAILWSYLNLPMHLKLCFAFCSLFPKDTRFERSYIVRLWMAHGFVVENNAPPSMTLVDIGEIYFDHLIDASLIEFDGDDYEIDDFPYKRKVKYYKMHDLVHDFASNILGDEFSEQGKEQGQKLRHFIATQSYSLRAFMLRGPDHLFDSRMGQLTTARSLCIDRDCSIDHPQMFLSQLFKKLSHVRYLDISGMRFSNLPKCVCSMSTLQTLILCKKNPYVQTIGFPNTMSKHLLNLHHIEAGHNVSRIGGLGRLTKLHSIGGRFILDEDNWQSIEELRNLKQMRGALEIKGLDHVQCSELVCKEPLLKNHGNLKVLVYDMSGTRYSRSFLLRKLITYNHLPASEMDHLGQSDHLTPELLVYAMDHLRPSDVLNYAMDHLPPSDVLNYLQPPGKVEDLQILNYTMDHLPNWLGNSDCNIVSLGLHYCSVKKLPQKLPFSLENLQIRFCNALEALPEELPSSLKHLQITFCNAFQALPEKLPPSLENLQIRYGRNLQAFPEELPSSLKHLQISYCNALQALPEELPPSLEKLKIEYCRNLQALPEKLPPSLEKLHIHSGDVLQALPEELPPSLEKLKIEHCRNLQALPEKLPPSLENLQIEKCDALQALRDELPSSLKHLVVRTCYKLQTLPQKLPSSLEYLDIWGCDNLQALPEKLPSSLKELQIRCYNLQALPQKLPSLLEYLNIWSCDNLQALPEEFPSSLERLIITECNKLQALPEKLPSSLKHLQIMFCNALQALPEELPPSLETLEIQYCDNLQALPKQLPSSLKVSVEGCLLLRRQY